MKIKRYTATSMRAALALVRAEQGPDAVILSSRRGDDGIEVIAAVDYDEALFVEMNRQRTSAPAIDPPAEAPARALSPAEAPARAPVPAPPSARAAAPATLPARAVSGTPATASTSARRRA